MARIRTDLPPVLDLFSGAGGLSQGFAEAGFPVPFAVDNWGVACETHRLNHPESSTLCGDLLEISSDEIRARFREARVVVGGPPCQGFSSAGKQLLDDPRNRLVEEYIRVVEILEPEAFLLENVKGFARWGKGAWVAEIQGRFAELGYQTAHKVLSATRYGLPQKRQRFMMIGFRDSMPRFPEETHQSAEGSGRLDLLPPPPTFLDAVSDLPLIEAGQESTDYLCGPQNDFQRSMRSGSNALTLHRAPGHRPHMVEMMSYIPQGKSAFELEGQMPANLMPTSGFPNSYARLKADEPGPTVTRNFTTPSSANCIHPLVDRALTLREGARLQTFRDTYEFAGNFGDIRLQIGNAVPPFLAKVVADAMANHLVGSLGAEAPIASGA